MIAIREAWLVHITFTKNLMVLLLSEGSSFHGMKVLAMLQKKFGIA